MPWDGGRGRFSLFYFWGVLVSATQDREFFKTFAMIMVGLVLIGVLAAVVAMQVVSGEPNTNPLHSEAAVAQRLAPVGQVRQPGDAEPAAPVASAAAAPSGSQAVAVVDEGSRVYQTFCSACHDQGIAGAPKTGDKAAWDARLAKGMDAVLQRAIKGFDGMPPRGTCMTCTPEQMQAAIDFMIAQ